MRKKYIKKEITGRICFPSSFSSKKIACEIKQYIRDSRKKNNINIIITNILILPNEISVEFCAEHIKKGFGRKHFIPTRFSIVTTLDVSDSLDLFLQEKSKKIKHYIGPNYQLQVIGQIMQKDETQILVCVLAEKSS